MSAQNALLVFIKTPKKNYVKTRLSTHLNPDEIISVYTAFLRDMDNLYKNLYDIDLWYVISPENLDLEVLRQYVDLSHYIIQEGVDLGERMCHAVEYSLKMDYNTSILIGSDIPDISIPEISEAISLLSESECILGPTIDGGYYLIGLKKCYPALFKNIDWSTDKVLKQTLNKGKKLDIGVKLLNLKDDIDTYKDLKNLYLRLSKVNKDSLQFPVETWKILSKLFK
jgi:rSAM/selenodomain-associated transferase 1